jgi:hypothetical protein
MLVAISFSFSSVEFFPEFVLQGLKPRDLKLFFAAVETAAYNDGMKEAALPAKSPLPTTGRV